MSLIKKRQLTCTALAYDRQNRSSRSSTSTSSAKSTRKRETPNRKRSSNIYEYALANSNGHTYNHTDNAGNVRGKHLYRFKWSKLFRGILRDRCVDSYSDTRCGGEPFIDILSFPLSRVSSGRFLRRRYRRNDTWTRVGLRTV